MRAGIRIGTAVASAAIACTAALSAGSTAASASTIHTTVTKSADIQPLGPGWIVWQVFNNTPLQMVICNLKGQELVETHEEGISAYACTPIGSFIYLEVFIP